MTNERDVRTDEPLEVVANQRLVPNPLGEPAVFDGHRDDSGECDDKVEVILAESMCAR